MKKISSFYDNNGSKIMFFIAILVISALILPLNVVHADKVIATIHVGSLPGAIAANPITNKVYVANNLGKTISVIDGNTNTVTFTIPLSYYPTDVKVNVATNRIYVSAVPGDIGYGSVYVIDGNTNAIVGTVTGLGRDFLGIDPNKNMIYVSDMNTPAVDVINGTTNTLTSTIPFYDDHIPWQPSVNPTKNMIYYPTVCNGCHQSYIVVINDQTNSRVGTILVGNRLSYSDINLKTNLVYVTDTIDNMVYVINSSNNSVLSGIPIVGIPNGVGANPNRNLIYVSSYLDNYTYIIDGLLNTIVGRIPVGPYPEAVAVNSNTNMIYVVNQGDDTVSVIDGNLIVSPSPTNLSATAVSSSQINLSWVAPSGGNGTITGYKIERSTDRGNTWNNMVNTTGTGTAYSDTRLNSSTQYTYRVSAINSVGTSSPSNTATATTFNVPQSPTNLSANTISPSQINLNWTAPANTGGTAIIGYKIERSNDTGTMWNNMVNTTGTGTAYSDTGLAAGIAYTYRVSAINSVGTSSPSNTATATTQSATAPQLPTNLSVNTISSHQINLSWVAPADNGGSSITGYKIERSNDTGTMWNNMVNTTGTGTAYSDTGLAAGIAYTYRVSAINSVGTSSPSNTATATTFNVPQSPTGLTATPTSQSQINLIWTAPSDNGGSAITGYEIERSNDTGITWNTIVSNTGTTNTTYSDTGLVASTTYMYRISAINAVGTSSPSNVSSATTQIVTSKLTVNAQKFDGTAISGIYIQLFTNGKQIASGYSPVTFTLNNTQTYDIEPNNYLTYMFDHWLDTGSTSNARDISITSDGTITAVYKSVP